MTFTWRVDASATPGLASFRSTVSLFDGTQWIDAGSVPGVPSHQEYSRRVFLTPGSYRWLPVIVEPGGCRGTPLPELSPLAGEPFVIEGCCDQVADLVGKPKVFSVRNGQPDLDLTDQLDQTDCVTTEEVIVVMPDSACPVTILWESPTRPSASNPRATEPVSLPGDGSPVDVTVRLFLPGCPPKTVTRTIRQCQSGGGGGKGSRPKWWCFGGEGCRIYEAMAIYPIIGFFFFVALATLSLALFIGFAVAAIISGGISTTIAIVLAVVTGFLVGPALCFLIMMVVFHILWFNCCSPTLCRWMEDIDWALGWSMIVCSFVPVSGWFFLPLQGLAFLIIRPIMTQNGCAFLLPLSLPHMR